MSTECIYNIDFTTNTNDVISVSSDNFNHFYIANIDDNGDETNYIHIKDSHSLYANFFMIKIIKDKTADSVAIINRLYERKDIVKIGVSFTNGRYQEFDLPKNRVMEEGTLENSFEDAFIKDDDLCIIITDKNILYKENLFA